MLLFATRKTLRVNLPIHACWEALTNFDRLPEWEPHLQTVLTLGADNVGKRIDLEYQHPTDPARTYAVFAFITRYKAPHELAWQYNRYGVTWEIRYELTDDGTATYIERAKGATGILGAAVWWWERTQLQQEERELILRLKEALDPYKIAPQ